VVPDRGVSLSVRPARPEDSALIFAFVRELADYEQLSHEVRASEADLAALLFGNPPRAFCDIAEIDGEPVGFALWYYSVSTFAGRCGLFLEDLYVRSERRGAGAGKALLAHLARRCLEEDLPRMEWRVLTWNAPSIAFYDSLGADALDDWSTRRLAGEALSRLAADA
jgi:GNAT superfamily N-acetyltransferase